MPGPAASLPPAGWNASWNGSLWISRWVGHATGIGRPLSLLSNDSAGHPLGRHPLAAAVLIPGACLASRGRRPAGRGGSPSILPQLLGARISFTQEPESGCGARLENSPASAPTQGQPVSGCHPSAAMTRRFVDTLVHGLDGGSLTLRVPILTKFGNS